MVTWTVCKILDILTFSPYKCLWYQIWPWPKIGQGHPRVIIWTNYDGPESPMPSFVEIGPAVPEKKIFEGLLPYMGMAATLVMWPGPLRTNFRSPIPWRLHMKFGFNRPFFWRGRRLKMLTDRYTDNGLAIWLRWAKNWERESNLFCRWLNLIHNAIKFHQDIPYGYLVGMHIDSVEKSLIKRKYLRNWEQSF